jgi:signal transduction histidine kinase
LYIDDEPHNLVGFKASFRLDYDVLLANSADEAMAMLEKDSDVQVIISDQRMPNKTGVEFFEEARLKFPAPVRMLLTGFTDIESVILAINKGNIFRYIPKPWTETEVRSAIEEGYKFYIAASMLEEKNMQLQKAYDELDKFAYSVTHDVRGPILSVLGAIGIAKQADTKEEKNEILDMMEKSIHRMDDFIQSMHTYYSLRRGELQIEEIDFEQLSMKLHELYDVSSRANETKLDIQVNQHGVFKSDMLSLEIVLNNLLSNAFKYQRPEESSKFVLLKIDVGESSATFAVEDNGMGIDESYLPDIFNMFYRASTDSPGSGFGLYNVKDALRKINGDVTVESTKGKGTAFVVSIPSK